MGGQWVRASGMALADGSDEDEGALAAADALSLRCRVCAWCLCLCLCSSISAAIAVRSFLWLRTRDNILPPELGMVGLGLGCVLYIFFISFGFVCGEVDRRTDVLGDMKVGFALGKEGKVSWVSTIADGRTG